jgi:hypothetical protein
MLSENKNNGDGFDKLLKDALKQYRQPTPADFPQRMFGRLQQLQQREALRRIVRQERALLVAFILLPAGVIAIMLAFPGLLLVPSRLLETLYLSAGQIAANMAQHWRLCIGYTMAAAVVIYAFYETLLADNY